MAKTGRETWPWSERKMGVYDKYDSETNSSTWLILQPTSLAWKLPELCGTERNAYIMTSHEFLFQSSLRM